MVELKSDLVFACGPFDLIGGILSSINVLLCILAMALPYWTYSAEAGGIKASSNIMMFNAESCVNDICASASHEQGSLTFGGVLCIAALFLNIFQAKQFLLHLPELDFCIAAIPCPFIKFNGFGILGCYILAFLLCTFGADVPTLMGLGGGAFCLILAIIIAGVCAYFNFAAPEPEAAPEAAAAPADPEAAVAGTEATPVPVAEPAPAPVPEGDAAAPAPAPPAEGATPVAQA